MAKIAVIGATGMLGSRILREALDRGHEVTAIVRDASRVPAATPHVTVRVADLFQARSLHDALVGHNAVISAYGPGQSDPRHIVKAAECLIEAVRGSGVRLIVVGGAGSLEVAPGLALMDAPDFPPEWKALAQAHADALALYRNAGSDLNWTYASPAAVLAPGERTATFRLGDDRLVTDAGGRSRISAEDFAVAILNEVESPEHIRRRFTAAY